MFFSKIYGKFPTFFGNDVDSDADDYVVATTAVDRQDDMAVDCR